MKLLKSTRCKFETCAGYLLLPPPKQTGQIVIHAENRPREVLHPGSTLGISQMLRRQPLPLDAFVDPNFEAQVASLPWVSYQAAVRGWAASRVTALAPELPAAAREKLCAAIAKAAHYVRLEAGQPLMVAGEDAGHLVLLVRVSRQRRKADHPTWMGFV